MHYERQRKHGSVDVVLPHQTPWRRSGEDAPHWKGDAVNYNGVHARLRRQRGRAGDQTCECGRPAKDWAYDHADPDERRDETHNGPYSTKVEHYIPMCRSCHRTFDNNRRVSGGTR